MFLRKKTSLNRMYHHEHHHEYEHEHAHSAHGHFHNDGHCCHSHEHHGHDHGHEHGHDAELSLKKIMLSAVLFTAALLCEKFFPHFYRYVPEQYLADCIKGMRAFSLALYAASYLICGLPVLREALEGIFHGEWFNEEFLMSAATVGAAFMGEYSEAAAVMILFQLGEFLEGKAVGNSRRAITSLLKIKSETARILEGSEEKTVPSSSVKEGSIIVVNSGERVPLDGIVVKGSALVDTAALTGESVPRSVSEGSEVLSGSINTNGRLEIKVTRCLEESAVSRILRLVEESQEKKSVSEKFIKRFAKVYTPIVCILAVTVAVIPPAILGGSKEIWHTWIYRALELLVVSCPCALVISVPLSFFSGIGFSSRNGILFKGSGYIENLSKCRALILDKTGTVTNGVFEVIDVVPSDESLSKEELLALASHAEIFSSHPVSVSLKNAHSCPLCGKLEVKNAEEISGHGIKCDIAGKTVLVGNAKLMQREAVKNFTEADERRGSVIYIAENSLYRGFIVISDTLKDGSLELVKKLKKNGIKKVFMFTGDEEKNASYVAEKIGADEYYSGLLPEDKVLRLEQVLSEFSTKKQKVAFAGDGINDAPVLTRSDVGISMGAFGSDSAVEASDVVIMEDNVLRIPLAVRIAKKTMRNVRENIFFSLFVKACIIALCAAGLADMWIAVLGDVGVTMIAVLNSARLLLGRKNK